MDETLPSVWGRTFSAEARDMQGVQGAKGEGPTVYNKIWCVLVSCRNC